MNTSKQIYSDQAFAVWLTGLPASGKSTIAAELVKQLEGCGVRPAVLESDALRSVLTPRATYSDQERDEFYGAVVYIGQLLVNHGVPVIFDATANRRAYRQNARSQIKRFTEVYVASPLAVCMQRDPKGIYRRGRKNSTQHVPGLNAEYEPPEHAELTVHAVDQDPQDAAARIVWQLVQRGDVRRPKV